MTPIDRLTKEIFSSGCFDNLRTDKNFNLNQWVVDKRIVPVLGDICKEGLGLSPEDRKMIVNDLSVIMNIAASVDFNERISDALQINYFGCLRMMELASECKNL